MHCTAVDREREVSGESVHSSAVDRERERLVVSLCTAVQWTEKEVSGESVHCRPS